MNHKKSICGAMAVTLVLFLALAGRAQVTAIKAGKLVDPDTGTTALNQIILVEGKKIKSIGTNLQVPPGATVIDLSGFTVLPGLFDARRLRRWVRCSTAAKRRQVIAPGASPGLGI